MGALVSGIVIKICKKFFLEYLAGELARLRRLTKAGVKPRAMAGLLVEMLLLLIEVSLKAVLAT